jgi:hypothetical protein
MGQNGSRDFLPIGNPENGILSFELMGMGFHQQVRCSEWDLANQ